MKHKKLILIPLIAFILISFLAFAFGAYVIRTLYVTGKASQIPNYELGEHRGAAACMICHNEIYKQWEGISVHATSTKGEGYFVWKDKVENNFLANTFYGMDMCHACQGPEKYGVDCEVCHGVMPHDWSFQETHEKKFKPNMEEIRKEDFCPKCHELPSGGMTTYEEWKESEAAAEGLTCQGCHMKHDQNGVPYHGFDSTARSHDVEMYRGDLVVKNIEYDFPEFSLAVENRVRGHAIPAVGPSRLLVLEISFQDSAGQELFKIDEGFAKYMPMSPIVTIFPEKVEKNTQLQSLETRPLSYRLPSSLKSQVENAVVTLRFYDVYDFYEGDLEMAHWISDPIVEEIVEL